MKYKKIIIKCLLIAFLVIYIVGIYPILFQNDTLFDICLGQKYVTSGISTVDDFSIHENLQYTPQHFLVNIITYYIYSMFNFKGLYILGLILTFILSLLLYTANNLFTKNKYLSYMYVFVELFLLSSFISVR